MNNTWRISTTLLPGIIVALLMFANSDAQQGQPQLPQFKAPPGYTVKTETKSSTYNFYPLKRGIPLPWDRLKLPAGSIPKGYSQSTNLLIPSPEAERYYNDPAKALPSFGTPTRKTFQAFNGKGGDGVVIFLEYSNVLQMDAKELLSKYFFNNTTPPDPNTSKETEQFLVCDHTVIVWCFRNPKSEARLEHQEYIFNLIGEVAQAKK